MTSPDLLYSDVEDDLRSSVRSLLADRCPPTAVLARCEGDRPHDLPLWSTLARELGLAGLLVPEALGGHGASAREAAVVLEELGAAITPVPFLSSAVLATSALLACRGAEPELTSLASGGLTAALAVPLSAAADGAFPGGVRADEDGVLTGRVGSVPDGAVADLLVVPAVGPDGPGLYTVRTDAGGVDRSAPVPLDLTRPIADISFEQAPGRLLAGPGQAEPALERALLTGAGLLASEQLGIAQWCLETTVAYLKERTQFARPVGSFQSLKHRLADLWLELVSARAAARNAADALAAGSPDAPVAVALAQAYCAPAAVRAAEECVQLHGGIGMTWEHPAHLFLKRAKADEIALGTPGRHRARLGHLVGLPG
ncbi:acyl-CoA dehydrogenase family protein [Wenjunlia tyrosinilytica]|uniref:Acyl-CoA dehydrogenase n=1 Tax=Wenjunlia tyrosinilytica TaxID=1544741 RepID=A0A918DSW9_9ACTN|nr:acyl-CoA dehydrogenase family protein [Wenjunlia tyrosinilytica]GGO82587.1 acyl-CoA dehydrogenase [Wenjunlia tyrosinilytica]